ncbi:hypothetical protein S245_038849 [Arachis hypogaea]
MKVSPLAPHYHYSHYQASPNQNTTTRKSKHIIFLKLTHRRHCLPPASTTNSGPRLPLPSFRFLFSPEIKFHSLHSGFFLVESLVSFGVKVGAHGG